MPIPLIASDHHLAHDGLVELVAGQPIPCYESPQRATVIREALLATGDYVLEPPVDHGPDPIAAVHEVELIDLVEHAWTDAVAGGRDPSRPLLPDTFLLGAYAAGMTLERLPAARHDRLGAYCFDTATPIVAGTAAAARAAVDIALTAVDRVLAGEPLAYGLCRPPGHHAGHATYGGYCFLNNAALAAQYLRDAGCARVAVLDVDYHHGNGTQDIFYARGDVLTVSIHGTPDTEYPWFLGYDDERGSDAGEGCNLNLPLPLGTGWDAYDTALGTALEAIARFAPSALVVSLGVDTYAGDPISAFALEQMHFPLLGKRIGGLGLPTVLVQEGGYAVEEIGTNVVGVLGGFLSA